ncbi:MAG: pseudouridylate synthase [Desulfobacteraceae bacterium]|nr:MAG: pseudouridylate synthase [Desulfobacteraceae bacterium]
MPSKPRILYMDSDIVAVHKPAGLKVHRDGYDDPRAEVLLQVVRNQTGRWIYPVHRLDRPASGVVLFGFTPDMARTLSDHFRQRKVGKTYLTVTRGYVEPSGSIDSPLTPNAYAPKHDQEPKPALTLYERLATVELDYPVGPFATCRYALVAVYPHTGRMHQIRRHFHHIRHPLIGDTAYGDARHNRFFREHFECRRLLLAAMELKLAHPRTGRPLHVVAPLEESFKEVLQKIGWLHQLPDAWRAG